jgi:hypothetical protein
LLIATGLVQAVAELKQNDAVICASATSIALSAPFSG